MRVPIISMSLLIAMCSASVAQADSGLSFKGQELYSWQTKDGWRYSILLGTNRMKQCSEIKAFGTTMDVMCRRLGALPSGEWVSWRAWPDGCGLAVPDAVSVDKIRKICKDKGIHLSGPDVK